MEEGPESGLLASVHALAKACPDFRLRGNYQFSRIATCNWRGVLKMSLFDVSLPKVEL